MLTAIFVLNVILFQINNLACLQSIDIKDVHIEWQNKGEQTEFFVTSSLVDLKDITDSWLAIGINNVTLMKNANVVVCRSSKTNPTVKFYVNRGYLPSLGDPSNPDLGISNAKVRLDQPQDTRMNVTCLFNRDNSNDLSEYFKIDSTSSYYILVAFGQGDMSYHGINKMASAEKVSFPVETTISDDDDIDTTDSIDTSTTPSTGAASEQLSQNNLLEYLNIILQWLLGLFHL